MTDWGVDLMSISAHKMHGPKGAGALVRAPGRRRSRRTRRAAVRRSACAPGTENTLARVGFGRGRALAAERLAADAPADRPRLRDRLEAGILARVPGARTVVAEGVQRLPNTSAVLFADASGETVLIRLDLEGVAVSVGSACSSGTLAPSPALLALGLTRREARERRALLALPR